LKKGESFLKIVVAILKALDYIEVVVREAQRKTSDTRGKVMTGIETVIRAINGGVFASVDYSIPAKSYIRKKATDGSNAINPLWDRKEDIRIERENVQINLGVVYGKAVQGRQVRKEIEPDFTPESLNKTGKKAHSNPHKNLCQNMAESKTYVRYMPMQNKNKTSRFVLDGVDVTAQLKPFNAKVSNYSNKQATAGLAEDEQIIWRTLDIANITALRVLGAEITQ
jgi:hypothetical protein